jgi:hypothetical protein
MKYLRIDKDILATLAYFNMFDYPLKKQEIFSFLCHSDNYMEFDRTLENLVKDSIVFRIGEFYCLQNNHLIAERRSIGNARAIQMLSKAEKVADIISAFPYVKGVAVSGSLSKYFADENADIDFFIITSANRLWICRTLLHLFKKLTFLLKMQDFFCMNYFIDEAESCIVEKNFYTAMEIVTILPLRGKKVFDDFYLVNNWTRIFFPNKHPDTFSTKKTGSGWLKRITEKLFNTRPGCMVDDYLMKLTSKRWAAKTRKNRRNSKGYLMSMCTDKHFSKPNPDHFQKTLLHKYEGTLADIYKRLEHSGFY